MKLALVSVFDKRGVADFARGLSRLGFTLLSTGGTASYLRQAGLPVTTIEEYTGLPEFLGGRVKTLHPKVHGAILARRDVGGDLADLARLDLSPIDLVAANLYPFKETALAARGELEEALDNIDIGGVTLLRAAAKNFRDVLVLSDPEDYPLILQLLETEAVSLETRVSLAKKAFSLTAAYDSLIREYLEQKFPQSRFQEKLTLSFELSQELRYGENPHQRAALYREEFPLSGGFLAASKLQGKALSYNNIVDAEAAREVLEEFEKPTAVVIKHANPCAVASSGEIGLSFSLAQEADPVSIFGGTVALNREVEEDLAHKLTEIFLEILMAPSFSRGARASLGKKKNLRLLEYPSPQSEANRSLSWKKIQGGLLLQERDSALLDRSLVRVVTKREPTAEEWQGLIFAWKVVKHARSNAIVLARGEQTAGIGMGQPNRVQAVDIALKQARERFPGVATVMASDAFFPFADSVELAHAGGIRAIIQPGGSIRDRDSIDLCDQYGIAMVFTGLRHFRH